MQNIICIIKEFEGIIGAILGSAVTLIITDLLKKKGKLNIYLNDFRGQFWYRDKNRPYDISKEKMENMVLSSYKFEFNIDIYNASELPKIMRNLKICIYKNKKIINEIDVNNEETRRVVSMCITVDKTTVFNIDGKSSYNLILSSEIPEENVTMLKDGINLKLKYKNEKNKDVYFNLFNGKILEEDNI